MTDVAAIGPGSRVGNALVEREIGAGAFGVVFLGRDTVIGRPVALKMLRATGPGLAEADRERLLTEARAIGALRSPHVVAIHQVHRLPGERWVLEMEYVDGGSLEDLLGADLRLPPETAVRVARGVLAGLARAHEAGVLHGDVKPANVLIGSDGSVKLADFGLARVLSEQPRDGVEPLPGGTPHYMAPEVLLGALPTAASDLWSVGVLLYRMVTGRLPFSGTDLAALFTAIQNAPHPPLDRDVPAAVEALVSCWLSKRPENRHVGAAEALVRLGREGAAADLPATTGRGERTEPVGLPSVPGREADLARVGRLLEHVAAGTGGSLVIVGPEGIGKSDFLRATAEHARVLGFREVATAVSPGEGLLRPLLRAAGRRMPGSGSAAAEIDPTRFGSATAVVRSLVRGDGPVDLEGRPQLVWAVRHLLQGLAQDGPLLVTVEDVHRADPFETSVLRDLAHRLGGHRVLVAVTMRTSEGRAREAPLPGSLADEEGATRVTLGPLPAESVYALVEARAGARLDPEVAARIVRVADGNPRFATEFFHHLEATGAVVRSADGVTPGPRWKQATVPDRLSDVVARRLSTLPANARSLLEAAAVDGVEFDGQALSAVLGRPLLGILRLLQRLSREGGLVVPLDAGFRFAHALVHETLYDEVAPELRRALHRAFAEHLETRASDVDPERLALHWERTGETGRARPYLLRAAAAAAGRTEFSRAVDLGRRAGLAPGQVSDEDARANPELLVTLARAHANSGSPREDVEALYEAAVRAADARRDPILRLRAIVRRAHYRFFRGGLAPEEETLVRSASDLLPVGEDLGRARYLLGVAAAVRGEVDEAERWLRGADAVFHAVPGTESARASVLDRLAGVAGARGRLGEAEDLHERAARLSDASGWTRNAAASRVNRVLLEFHRGRVTEAEGELRRAIRYFSLDRSRELAGHTSAMLAEVLFAAGDLEGASRAVDDAFRTLAGTSYLPGLRAAHLERASQALAHDEAGEARAAEAEARECARRRGDAGGEALCDVILARIRCAEGDVEGAAAALRGAWERMGRRDVRPLAHAAMAVAELSVWGLPGSVASEAQAVLADLPPDADEAVGVARKALAAARAYADRTDPGALEAGAAALESGAVGERCATLRVVGRVFAAEAAGLRGDPTGAARERAAAVAEARRLGDRSLSRRLDELAPRATASA